MTRDLTLIPALRRFTRRGFGATLVAAALAACGGGGGGDDAAGPALQSPPTVAATLTQSGGEAMAAVQALNSGAATIVSKNAALEAGALFAPVGASSSPLNLRSTLARTSRERALARETVGCADLGLSPCSGSVTLDISDSSDGTVFPAGSHATATFNGLSFSDAGSAFSINGMFRIDFLTAIDFDVADFANARLQITLSNLSGNVEGVSFGPESAVALYEFDGIGMPAVTIDGLRMTGLDSLNVTDADNYSAIGTRARLAHWAAASTYVDVNFSNWSVSAGRPTAGSTATITAGTGSVSISVDGASASQVVYLVDVSAGGVTTSYQVTATLGANAPAYTFVAL
jgi:hypothetical protein